MILQSVFSILCCVTTSSMKDIRIFVTGDEKIHPKKQKFSDYFTAGKRDQFTHRWIDEYKNINFTIKQYLSEGWQPCLYCMFWHLHTAPILDFPGGKVFHVNGMKINTLSELFWPFWPFSAEVKRFVTNECTLCAWSGKENKSRCLQLVPINQKCI